MLILYYYLTVTGYNFAEDEIKGFHGVLEKDGKPLETIDLPMRTVYDLDTINEQLPDPKDQYKALCDILSKHMLAEKVILCGWGNLQMQEPFLKRWLDRYGHRKFQETFYYPSIDIMPIAAAALAKKRPLLPDFKLKTIWAELGGTYELSRETNPQYIVGLIMQLARKLRVNKPTDTK
jgi:hypothetical protein